MTAALNFYTEGNLIPVDQGSGLGFYGDSGFAASIAVAAYNGRTFIADSAGATQGPEGNNVKYLNAGSGILGQTGSGIGLAAIPNYQSTLNIHFTNDSAVKIQNAYLYAYDRVSKNNSPSGVTFKAAEIIHPNTTQSNTGSGDTTWSTIAGTGVALSLCPSPGVSGLTAGNGSNGNVASTVHDWFAAISVSPDSIGSKTQSGILVELEYY